MNNVKLYGNANFNAYPSGDGEIDVEFHSGDGDYTSVTINMEYNFHSNEIEIDCIDIHFHEDKDGNELSHDGVDFEDAIIELMAEHDLMTAFQEAVSQAASDAQ